VTGGTPRRLPLFGTTRNDAEASIYRGGQTRGRAMVTCNLEHFPIQFAYLCQDCNSIGNCPEQCPACASHALMSLSAVLNREAEQRQSPVFQMRSVSQPPEIEQHIARVA
jgi:hypothetical protein